MKVAIDTGPLTGGHAIRGVGKNTDLLIKAITGLKDKEIQLYKVDFSKENLTGFDLVHYQYFHPYLTKLPAKFTNRTILTIHDLIPLIYPKQYPPGLRGKLNFIRLMRSVKNADAVITISETSKKDIVRYLNISADKIHVTYLAPSENFSKVRNNTTLKLVREKYSLPLKYVFYLGDVNYNKNLPTLVRACQLAGIDLVISGKQAKEVYDGKWATASGFRDVIRKIAGKTHPELAHLTTLNSLFNNNNVQCLGFVPEKDLEDVFKLAECYCQPSYYEGFGLPVLVAMSIGCPVIISKTNALVEIAAGSTLTADPQSPEDFAEKLGMIIKDANLRAHIIREGEKRVREFSWEKCARETVELYKNIIRS